MVPGSAVASEWIVEARAGGTCVVRVVHSWFASTDEWDNQFEGHEHGWRAFFRILRLFLKHFRGQPCASFQLMARCVRAQGGGVEGAGRSAWTRGRVGRPAHHRARGCAAARRDRRAGRPTRIPRSPARADRRARSRPRTLLRASDGRPGLSDRATLSLRIRRERRCRARRAGVAIVDGGAVSGTGRRSTVTIGDRADHQPAWTPSFLLRDARSAHEASARRLPAHRTAGSMPLLRMSGAASGADMNFTIMVAASGCFDTANTPAENTT